MNNLLLKKLLPHVIALVLFVIVSMIFCWPAMQGNVLNQHDNVGWKGMAQNAFEYKEKTGHFPLWNPNLFSGMPNYQVAMEGKSVIPDTIKILSVGLPKPVNFFFLACVFFLCTNPGVAGKTHCRDTYLHCLCFFYIQPGDSGCRSRYKCWPRHLCHWLWPDLSAYMKKNTGWVLR
ncbi:MAG: hypothetical protein IPM85_11800 [Chitinophagaceae bacterium]|nr:hypothetical protein [Chitinophagaceae bacterium]